MSVPVYDARALGLGQVDINKLQSCQKDGFQRLENTEVMVGAFVAVVYSAKWIPSQADKTKERVHFHISELYLLADPEVV